MNFPKAKVCFENGSKVLVLLDTGAETNIIIKKSMQNTRLAMTQDACLELVSYTGHSQLLLDLCKDVKVVVNGLKIRHSIFVIEHKNHNLILRQSFLNSVKFS